MLDCALGPNERPPLQNGYLHSLIIVFYFLPQLPNSQGSFYTGEIIYFPKLALLNVNVVTPVAQRGNRGREESWPPLSWLEQHGGSAPGIST